MKSMLRRLVVDYIEDGVFPITLWTHHNWLITVEAKIDTGADRSSIDIGLVEALEFLPANKNKSKRFRSANGVSSRKLYRIPFRLNEQHQELVASATDRSNMRYPMIIGRDDFLEICYRMGIEEEE